MKRLILAEIETSEDGKYCSLNCGLVISNENGESECPFFCNLNFPPIQICYTQERHERCLQAEKDLEQLKGNGNS